MLQIQNFTFNPFQENTYIIFNELSECWIIDPGMSNALEEKEIAAFIESKKLIPKAIINTHAHIDHVLGVDFMAKKYQIPFYLHEKELPILLNAANTAKMFGFQYNGVESTVEFISVKEPLILGADQIELRFVPGHSPGSIALYYAADNWVISGDTLFAGSIGRTDLPMGNHDTLINSIKQEILSLPDETEVYSGHGSKTRIKTERAHNPFLM
jgi:hydroxyacylglutathione hydrolase